MTSDRLATAVFAIVIAQLLSALAVPVLAFAAPNYMFIALNMFGFFLAIRAGIFAIYGLVRGSLPYHKQVVDRSAEPLKYWD